MMQNSWSLPISIQLSWKRPGDHFPVEQDRKDALYRALSR